MYLPTLQVITDYAHMYVHLQLVWCGVLRLVVTLGKFI